MLRIKQVETYTIARYPRGEYRPFRRSGAAALVQSGALSATLLLVLESCEGTGTTGPPPVEPDLLTENEARAAITRVFTDNGIALTADVPLTLLDGNGDPVDVVLDGYNDAIRIGYEYITRDDRDSFTQDLIAGIDTANAGTGPYVGAATATYYESDLEQFMQAFIDTLKAQGKI